MVRPPRDPDDTASFTKDGRIDPANTDAAKPPRRRKLRNRPEPASELKQIKAGTRKRANARPIPPDIMLEPAGDFEEEHWTAPHSDLELWQLQLADAFGTRSLAVLWAFLSQLEALCGKNYWDEEAQQWRLNEHELCAALAMVNSIKPRNELEAALAAQAVAIHLLTMKVTARAIKYDYDTRMAATAARLARTYVMQIDAINRARKPNRTVKQSIKVSRKTHHHQHIHVHRGDHETDGQPHGRGARTVDACAALPGPDEAGHGLPLPGDARKACVPRSRRQKPRRPQG